MNARATLTSKGQITLPKEFRDRHGLKPGDTVEFIEYGGKTWVKARNVRAVDLIGILGPPPSGEALTVEQMNEAIKDAVAEDDARIQREWHEGIGEMIGVDTNVLIRLLANDDARQAGAVRAFLLERGGRDPAYISAVVLAETVWILESRLRYPVEAIISALLRLLASDDLSFQHADRLNALLDRADRPRADLADYLISWSAEAAGCSHTVTFDRRAAKFVPGMELLA